MGILGRRLSARTSMLIWRGNIAQTPKAGLISPRQLAEGSALQAHFRHTLNRLPG